MRKMKTILALFLSAVFCCCAMGSVFASDMEYWDSQWDRIVQDEAIISVTPGQDSSELRFCWLSDLTSKNEFRIGISASLTQENSLPVEERPTITAQKRCSVTASNLQPNTEYFYMYTKNGVWSDIYSVKTDAVGEPLTVLTVADIQLGRSGDWKEKDVLLHDLAGWDTTLQAAMETNPDISLCLSAGDQAEIGIQEQQYRLFLAPEILRSLPIATTIGNHEFYFQYLNMHFEYPNRRSANIVHSLGDEPYYFTKGNTLFIVLDGNNVVSWDHEAVLDQAIRAYPDTRWRTVLLHQSIYGCQDSKKDAPMLRETLAPLLQKYGIDLVVSGHSHRYSRSKPIMDGAASENGVVYLECGCSSGCNGHSCPDVLPAYTQYGYPASDPVYSVLDFGEETIEIKSYAVIDGESVLMDSGSVSGMKHGEARMSFFARLMQRILSVFGSMLSVIFA